MASNQFMDNAETSKGGLDNIQQQLCKIENSLEKLLGSLNYVREPTPSADSEDEAKTDSEGTIPSITHTVGRLQKLAESLATTVSVIRYG